MRVVGPEQAPAQKPEVDAEAQAQLPAELSLWNFIDPIVSSWAQIAVIALLGAGLGLTFASLRRPIYEATAVVRVAGDQVDAARGEYLRRLLENGIIASELIREFGITSDSAWKILSRSKPTAADTFLENHINIEPVPSTNLLRISVRLGNAELAAKVANEWVARGNALSRRISQQDVIDGRINTQLEQVERRLDTLQTDLLALKQKSQVGARDVSTTLLELQAAIEYERVFLAYVDLSTKYKESARVAAGNSGTQLQVVDPAVAPSEWISPRVMTTTQLGGALGLLVGCLLVLARHFFYRHRAA